MSPERWRQVEEAYLNVTVLEEAARPAFLEKTCRNDPEMRHELESLLDCENKIGQFLEQTAIEALVAEYGSDVVADVAAEDERDLVGALLGDRYVVGEHIGSGGAGDVYRAQHRLLEAPVAIKRLSRDLRNIASHRNRFLQEARRAVLLDHENIARVRDVVERGDEVFVVMEYIHGETLRARLDQPLPMDEFLDLAAQCTLGVSAAHRERIVHLDLKPENIMITASGKVKVCDFGVARRLSSADGSQDTDEPWVFAGTPAYMAPEVIASNQFDARADIFSLGAVFYEAVSGQHPFRAATVKSTMQRIVDPTTSAPRLVRRQAPRRLARLLGRMLAKDAASRPSAEEVFLELQTIRRRHGRIRRAWSAVRDMPAQAAARPWAAASAFLALVVAVAPLAFEPDLLKSLMGSSSAPRMVAVLPFTNVGGDPANKALSDGLVETLSTRLSQFERFQNAYRVAPASEVRAEEVASARQAKKAFGAAFAITGSIQRLSADRIRLTVNVVDTATLSQTSDTMDQDLLNLAAIQDSVVMKVTELLHGTAPANVASLLAAGRPTQRAAYQPYLEGRGRLQLYQNPTDVDAAIELFQASIRIDERYAAAHAALGEAYWRKYELRKQTQFVDLATQSCQTALKLDDALASVYVTLAMIANGTGHYDQAIAHAQRALAINPVDQGAYSQLANGYRLQTKLLDAESAYQQAIAARPNDWSSHNDLGSFYFKLQRFSEAAAQYRIVVQLAPDNVRGLNNLGAAYVQSRRYREAEAVLKRSISIRDSAGAYSNLGAAYYYGAHDAGAAARMFERAATIEERNYKYWRNAGAAYANSGHKDEARVAYERAIEVAEKERATNPRSQPLLVALADCYAMTGQSGRALEYLRQAMAVAPLDTTQMEVVGEVYEALGQRALAIEWIGRALRDGFSRDIIQNSPSLASLRSDPAFQAVAKH